MSKALRDLELKFSFMDKLAYALVHSLKHFRVYIGYSNMITCVPHTIIKDTLAQQDYLGIRGNWVSITEKYDLEIKPTKIIKGQGLAKVLIEGNERAINIGCPSMISTILEELEHHDWDSNIVYYLKNLSCLDHLSDHKRRALRIKTSKHCLI